MRKRGTTVIDCSRTALPASSDNKMLCVMGGRDHMTFFSDIHFLDLSTHEWTTLGDTPTPVLPAGLAHHAALVCYSQACQHAPCKPPPCPQVANMRVVSRLALSVSSRKSGSIETGILCVMACMAVCATGDRLSAQLQDFCVRRPARRRQSERLEVCEERQLS